MNTEIAVDDKNIVNPLAVLGVTDATERIDAVIDALITSGISQIETEVQSTTKRRTWKAAFTQILRIKQELDTMVKSPIIIAPILKIAVDGLRPDLMTAFKTLNPDIDDKELVEVVKTVLNPYIVTLDAVPESVTVGNDVTVTVKSKKKTGKADVG